jgi:hypothetical protein
MLQTKTAALSPGSDDGTFHAILSTPSVDRDGESLGAHQWKQPLPKSIAITVDHTGSVADVVASGEPYLAPDGSLRLKGRFAATEKGQQIRQLVVGGHVDALSVEFLRRKSADGSPINELTAASFVLLPANTDAVVLSAKAFNDQLEQVIKAASAGADTSAMVRAIHDAAVHLGAQCVAYVDDMDPTGEADDLDPDHDGDIDSSGASDGANKTAALRLRLKALSR